MRGAVALSSRSHHPTARMPMRPAAALLISLLFVVLPAGAQSALTNQNLFDTGPFLPEHYARRVAQFGAEPVVTGRVMFLGDSITEGGDWAFLTGDPGVVNRGIGGDVTFGVLDRLGDVTRRRPAKLFVLIGINDIGKDIPEAVVADNVRQLVERVKAESPETQLYLQSVLPVAPAHPGFPQHYDKEYHVLRLNRLLREVAAAASVHFVNLYPVFTDARGALDDVLTDDGLHLNEAGYRRWVDHLRMLGHL